MLVVVFQLLSGESELQCTLLTAIIEERILNIAFNKKNK